MELPMLDVSVVVVVVVLVQRHLLLQRNFLQYLQ